MQCQSDLKNGQIFATRNVYDQINNALESYIIYINDSRSYDSDKEPVSILYQLYSMGLIVPKWNPSDVEDIYNDIKSQEFQDPYKSYER